MYGGGVKLYVAVGTGIGMGVRRLCVHVWRDEFKGPALITCIACYFMRPQNHLSPSPSTGIQSTTVPCLALYMGAEDPNSVPNAFTTVSM